MADKKVWMPEALTAENGAKKLLIGEFHEVIESECTGCNGDACDVCEYRGYFETKIPISWTTIKAIYAKAVEHLSAKGVYTDSLGNPITPQINLVADIEGEEHENRRGEE